MGIAIDASTPAITPTNASSHNTVSTPSFSPPGGALLILGFGNSSNVDAITAITDSLGSHLTYTKLIAKAGNNSDAELWVADVPGTAPGAMTITATFSASANDEVMLGCVVVTGAANAAAQVSHGNTNSLTSASGKPTLAVTGTASGSLVIGAVGDFSGDVPTADSGQTLTFNGHSYLFNNTTNGATNWMQTPTSLSAGGTVTISDGNLTTDAFCMVVAEFTAAGGGGGGTAWYQPPRLTMMGVGT